MRAGSAPGAGRKPCGEKLPTPAAGNRRVGQGPWRQREQVCAPRTGTGHEDETRGPRGSRSPRGNRAAVGGSTVRGRVMAGGGGKGSETSYQQDLEAAGVLQATGSAASSKSSNTRAHPILTAAAAGHTLENPRPHAGPHERPALVAASPTESTHHRRRAPSGKHGKNPNIHTKVKKTPQKNTLVVATLGIESWASKEDLGGQCDPKKSNSSQGL